MYSDDELMDRLVLKGGSALDIVHGISQRSSLDIDFSIHGDFSTAERDDVSNRIRNSLTRTFVEAGLHVFDFEMSARPPNVSDDLAEFWGGYLIEFKLIQIEERDRLRDKHDRMQVSAVDRGDGKKFSIDISRHEYVEGCLIEKFDGFQILVYSPEMMVCEKLRAICQQMPEYGLLVKRNRPAAARARDFVDIHSIFSTRSIALGLPVNRELLTRVFAAKRVPRALLSMIGKYREIHRADFSAVMSSFPANTHIEEFDFYFDFVLEKVRELEPLGDE